MSSNSMLSRLKTARDETATRVVRESRNESMRVILEVLQGPRKGRSFMFDRHDTFIVGRSRFVHCSMPEDMALSRDHFMIEINPPLCEMRDLGSTNGTFVNNQKVDRTRLASGDVIAAGQSVFRVRVDLSSALEQRGSAPGSGPRGDADRDQRRSDAPAAGRRPPRTSRSPGRSRATRPRSSSGGAPSAAPSLARLPQPVPHYTTLREIGRGAMGVVYQARHNQTGQMVALKLIMPETATTRTAIDRFYREMSVISQLRHPNVVEWYEQGMTRGQFWFAMEYVAGSNLEALAKEHPGRYPDEPGLPADLPDPQGAGAGPPDGLRPSRHQAREHPDRPGLRRPARQDLRLRPGQELPRRGPLRADLLGRDAGHGPVHAARADARLQDRHPAGRPLRHGGDALLPADLQVHLRRADRRRRPHPHAPGRAPGADPQAPGRRPGAAGRRHREVPGPRPQGAVPRRHLDAAGRSSRSAEVRPGAPDSPAQKQGQSRVLRSPRIGTGSTSSQRLKSVA